MPPRPDLITPLGWRMLGSLPPILRDDPDYRALIHCSAREVERMRGRAEDVRAMGNPVTTTALGIPLWERLLRLPASFPTDPLEGRRVAVVNRWRALQSDPSTAAWVARVTQRLNGAPWTYDTPRSAPGLPDYTIRVTLPFNAASGRFAAAILALREETPAEQELVYVSAEGFVLDQSRLDQEGLGI